MAGLSFTSSCTGCGACLLTCPTHAIRPDGGRLTAREELCTGCGECVDVCPADAVELTGYGVPAGPDPAAGWVPGPVVGQRLGGSP